MRKTLTYAFIFHGHVRRPFTKWSSLKLVLRLNLGAQLRSWLNFDWDLLNKAKNNMNACNAELVLALQLSPLVCSFASFCHV